MKEWLEQPGFLSPYGTMGADLSFALAVGFTTLFLVGWRQAKRRKGQVHHVVTLWAMLAMIAYFVAYYVNRGLGALAFEGEEGFGGPPELYDTLFSPLLTFHILVVTIGLVMAVYMSVLGFRTSVRRGAVRTLTTGTRKVPASRFPGGSCWRRSSRRCYCSGSASCSRLPLWASSSAGCRPGSWWASAS
jgi:hypothetical protein